MNTKTSRILSAIMFQMSGRPSIGSNGGIIGIDQYRQLLDKGSQFFKPDTDVDIKSDQILGLKAQWHIPAICDDTRIICYIHGGGYIAGSVDSHRDLASRIAKAARSKLLIFDYRLAPEHPFPAGLEDVKKIYSWLTEKFARYHTISIAGDSAGGGLALALTADLMKSQKPLPKALVLLSPWIDLKCAAPSYDQNQGKDFMLSKKTLDITARYYTDQDLSHPLISPINNSFKGIPPVLIQVGENEILLDDSKQLARKIEQHKGTVCLEIWENMFHVWHYFARYLPEGEDAIARIGEFLTTHSQ